MRAGPRRRSWLKPNRPLNMSRGLIYTKVRSSRPWFSVVEMADVLLGIELHAELANEFLLRLEEVDVIFLVL